MIAPLRPYFFSVLLLALSANIRAQHDHEHHSDHSNHAMSIDLEGMVMNSNSDTLPKDCPSISADIDIEVTVGRKFARRGLTYGYSDHVWAIKPCTRLKVTLINDDEVRHQWMVHGLPRYLYPQGMFHLEAHGGTRKVGSIIVPSDDRTYLVHCDISKHMEQGLKGQIIVGRGSGTLPSIPGVSGARYPDVYRAD